MITVDVRLSERDGGTRMEIRSTYASRKELGKADMGMLEGLQQAVSQMDALLAAGVNRSKTAGPHQGGRG